MDLNAKTTDAPYQNQAADGFGSAHVMANVRGLKNKQGSIWNNTSEFYEDQVSVIIFSMESYYYAFYAQKQKSNSKFSLKVNINNCTATVYVVAVFYSIALLHPNQTIMIKFRKFREEKQY